MRFLGVTHAVERECYVVGTPFSAFGPKGARPPRPGGLSILWEHPSQRADEIRPRRLPARGLDDIQLLPAGQIFRPMREANLRTLSSWMAGLGEDGRPTGVLFPTTDPVEWAIGVNTGIAVASASPC